MAATSTKPEELQLEEAVSRVAARADASSPPEVTWDEVRCILESVRFPLRGLDEQPPPRLETSPSLWDEDHAVFDVVDLKCRRAVVLISSSSAGQSHGMSEVYQHLVLERSRLQPYECG